MTSPLRNPLQFKTTSSATIEIPKRRVTRLFISGVRFAMEIPNESFNMCTNDLHTILAKTSLKRIRLSRHLVHRHERTRPVTKDNCPKNPNFATAGEEQRYLPRFRREIHREAAHSRTQTSPLINLLPYDLTLSCNRF